VEVQPSYFYLVLLVRSLSDNANVIHLFDLKDELLITFPDISTWHGPNMIRKLKIYMSTVQAIRSHDNNIGTLVYTEDQSKLAISIFMTTKQTGHNLISMECYFPPLKVDPHNHIHYNLRVGQNSDLYID
jgi:hypothetical protein